MPIFFNVALALKEKYDKYYKNCMEKVKGY
jgi:hypothetical protein